MELVKKRVHMDRVGNRADAQTILEEDVNVSDNKPDVRHVLADKDEILLEEVRVLDQVINVKGKLKVNVLYMTDMEGVCESLEVMLPFDEKINMEHVKNGDRVNVKSNLEDLSIGLINSRKLSVQAVIIFVAKKEEQLEEEAAVDILHQEPLEYRKCTIPTCQNVMQKKDLYRMKEEIEVTGNLPNIFRLIWSSITFGRIDIRPMENKLSIQGDMNAFFLYEGEGDSAKTVWYEKSVPFSGTLDCQGCGENLISDISYRMLSCNVEVRQDFDGEDRVFCVEPVLEFHICMYEQENMEVLSDLYGVDKEIESVVQEVSLQKLLPATACRHKAEERVRIQNQEMPVSRILHSEGKLQIDKMEASEGNVNILGTLSVCVLYLSSGDEETLCTSEHTIPVEYSMDVSGADENSILNMQCFVEQLSVTMVDGEEMEVKANLLFKPLIFGVDRWKLITDIKVEELDSQKMAQMPGMVIYVVKDKDTLWNIGKKYYVSIDRIKEINELAGDEVKAGDKLLIVRGE